MPATTPRGSAVPRAKRELGLPPESALRAPADTSAPQSEACYGEQATTSIHASSGRAICHPSDTRSTLERAPPCTRALVGGTPDRRLRSFEKETHRTSPLFATRRPCIGRPPHRNQRFQRLRGRPIEARVPRGDDGVECPSRRRAAGVACPQSRARSAAAPTRGATGRCQRSVTPPAPAPRSAASPARL